MCLKQDAAMSNSRLYCEQPQRSYRVREAHIAAENSRVTDISQPPLSKDLMALEVRIVPSPR